MIELSDVELLLKTSSEEPAVLSLYLPLPVDPAGVRALDAAVDRLVWTAAAAAVGAAPGAAPDLDTDRREVRRMLGDVARDWPGETAALFSCRRLGLTEVLRLPGALPARAVLATRPHVRPLVAALQRFPAYRIAVVDRRHAWLFRVSGERAEATAGVRSVTAGVRGAAVGAGGAASMRGSRFGGWYGLEEHRVNNRVIQFVRHHYQDVAEVLRSVQAADGPEPLVVGGHQESVAQFVGALPREVSASFIGSFIVDPHTLTMSRARALATPVVQEWIRGRDDGLVRQVRAELRSGVAVIGAAACVAAVNRKAAQSLMLPVDGMVPGVRSVRCGELGVADVSSCACAGPVRRVPDVLEEMLVGILDAGGEVQTVDDPPGGVAARLRFPVARHAAGVG